MLADEQPDEIWCLGDLVGYGANPNECCHWTARRAHVCLAGNHDLGVLGTIGIDDFSPDASAAALWTRRVLTGEVAAYLRGLSSTATRAGVGLYHASPLDPVWHYVLSVDDAVASLAEAGEGVVLVGHTHVPTLAGEHVFRWGADLDEFEVDLATGPLLINPGSVGQPRDGDPRAAWLVLDLDARRAFFRRTPYDVAGAQAAIHAEGLPDALAERLARGL